MNIHFLSETSTKWANRHLSNFEFSGVRHQLNSFLITRLTGLRAARFRRLLMEKLMDDWVDQLSSFASCLRDPLRSNKWMNGSINLSLNHVIYYHSPISKKDKEKVNATDRREAREVLFAECVGTWARGSSSWARKTFNDSGHVAALALFAICPVWWFLVHRVLG